MSYKTILVHADGSPQAAQRIRLAARLALAHDAHLVGAAMTGLSRHALPDGSIVPIGTPYPFDLRLLRSRAEAALTQFADCASHMGLPSFEARLVDDAMDDGLLLQSPYADLLVLGQGDPKGHADDLLSRLPQDVMFQCARPLLIVPHAGQFELVGDHILVGWDASVSATHALTAALPMLRRAARVTLAVDASGSQHGRRIDLPGAELARYLARHDVRVTLAQLKVGSQAGVALLTMASDVNADLLVMGGYGHWRLREWMLGGATRSVLHDMALPVLMAH